MLNHRLLYIASLLGTLLLTGCAGKSSSSDSQIYSSESRHPAPITSINTNQGPRYPRPPAGMPPPDTTPHPSSNVAVASLLQQAAQARAAGDFSRAQTLAERAQALAPREAQSYLELARIYQARGDNARARQMALRGLSVVDNDDASRYELQLLSAP